MPPIEDFTPGVIGGIIYLGAWKRRDGFFIMVNGLKMSAYYFRDVFKLLPVSDIFGWLFLRTGHWDIAVAGQHNSHSFIDGSNCKVRWRNDQMIEKLNLTMLTNFIDHHGERVFVSGMQMISHIWTSFSEKSLMAAVTVLWPLPIRS